MKFAAMLIVALSVMSVTASGVAFAQGEDTALRLAAACAPHAGVGTGPAGGLRILGSQDTVARYSACQPSCLWRGPLNESGIANFGSASFP